MKKERENWYRVEGIPDKKVLLPYGNGCQYWPNCFNCTYEECAASMRQIGDINHQVIEATW